jgi:prevent-host-death family protein
MAKVAPTLGAIMQHMSARDAKNGFGRLIDTARAEPVAIEKHGRVVVVVIASEEYERLIRAKLEPRSKPSANDPPGDVER